MNSKTFSLNLSKIGQIAIGVSDIDRATEFYRDTLGMRFLFSAPPVCRSSTATASASC